MYFFVVDKRLKYPEGRSRIAYIGTSRNGLDRVLTSVAERAKPIFEIHGVNRIQVYTVGCAPRRRVKAWRILERACLLAFRDVYGKVPWENVVGKALEEDDEFEYFDRGSVRRLLKEIGR